MDACDGGPRDAAEPVLTERQRELWTDFSYGAWTLYRGIQSALELSGTLIGNSDWRVLERLMQADKMRIGDLAKSSNQGLSTVSRMVSRMVAAGYVERAEADGRDGRQRWVRITPAGAEAVRPILEERDRIVRRMVIDRIGDDDFELMCRLFRTITDGLPGD